jgi:transcriptional regulator with XRE-family HTH domain
MNDKEKRKLGRPLAPMPENVASFGDWLRRKRVERGLSQPQLTALTGLQGVSFYERGMYGLPSPRVMLRISELFGNIPEHLIKAKKS